MPGGDRTGPMGEGARTGRGMGYCGPGSAAEVPAERVDVGRGFGPGFGRGGGGRGGGGRGRGGRGGGRGWRNLFHLTGLTGWQRAAQAEPQATQAPTEQEQALRQRVTQLEGELAELKQRLDKADA